MASDRPLPYRPEIDGLRAVAVLPVLLFHAGLGCPGGYVGVDVFFVISGYLIGSLILRECESGEFRFTRFWVRRIRRLFPALAVTLAATAVAAWFLLIPTHLEETGAALIAQPLLVANVLFWSQSGYFETASEYQPLLHTWSLAVEEQFYLFLPLLLVPLLKRGRRPAVIVTWLFIAVSFAWSLHATVRFPSAAFYLLPSRIWELDLGLALALLPRAGFRDPRTNELASLAGLTAILAPVFLYDAVTPFPGVAALAPCLGTALLIYANAGPLTTSGRVLASPLPVWIGKISYPLYLWHWPILVFVRYTWPGTLTPSLAFAVLAVSFLLAWATWRWIERPVREQRAFASTRSLALASVVCSTLFVAVGVTFEAKDGFRAPATAAKTAAPDEDPVEGFHAMRAWDRKGGPFVAGSRETDAKRLLLWGDSHAMATLPVLDELGQEFGVAVYAACEPGNAPLFGTRPARIALDGRDFEPAVRGLFAATDFDAVLLVAKWPIYLEEHSAASRNYLLTDAGGKRITEGGAARLLVDRLGETARFLEGTGGRVHLMRSVAHQPLGVPETIAQARSRGLDENAFSLPLTEHEKNDEAVNRLLDEAIAGTRTTILDPRPFFTDAQGRYLMSREGQALYTDRSHLSPHGSRELRKLFEPLFREINGPKAAP
jgi:peptidoglycan/LPS O-acetylase OafA/YrhL